MGSPIKVPRRHVDVALPFNFTPRTYQVPVLRALDSGKKRAVVVWHRRAGKEKTMINYVARAMHDRVGSYYYFFPTAVQARKVIWDGMDREGFKFLNHFPAPLVKRKNSTEMLIEYKNGSIFQLIGTDKFDHIMGTNPIFCVFSEYSLQDPRAWDYIRPILLENGGIAVFDFTPRGKNHAFRLYNNALAQPDHWFVEKLTVAQTFRPDGTRVITDEMIQQERADGMTEEMIEQEYYCSFEGVLQGAYYAKDLARAEAEGRIGVVPWEPDLGVETWWDIGVGDTNAIWFTQSIGREVRVIDYLEASGESMAFYAKELKAKPYVYLSHNGPHDLRVREYAAGGAERPLSRIEVGKQLLGMEIKVVPDLSVDDGINAVRGFLGRCWFDRKKCERGLDALWSYQKEYDEKTQRFRSYPLHNWASNGADAFRYLAVGHKVTRRKREEQAERAAQLEHQEGANTGWMGA